MTETLFYEKLDKIINLLMDIKSELRIANTANMLKKKWVKMELDHIMLFDNKKNFGIDIDFLRLSDGSVKILYVDKLNRDDLHGSLWKDECCRDCF